MKLSACVSAWVLALYLEMTCAQTQINGAGSTLAAPLYQDAALVWKQQPQGTLSTISFYATGSGKGICRLENNCSASDTIQPRLVDFAGTDSILSAADYRQFSDIQLYPAVAAAVVPVYNLPGIDNLVLSLDVLARIYYGAITKWNDPMIANLNPTIRASLPSNNIEEVARSDGSGTTEIFKKALANASSTFRTVVGTSSGATWGNNTNNLVLKAGNLGVISHVAAARFSIGYAALGEAKDAFLQIARLSRGSSTISPTTTAIKAAVQVLGASFGNNGDLPTTRLTADLAGAAPPAWPIVGYTYFAMRKSFLRTNATCENVYQTVAFLNFFYTSPLITSVIEKRLFAPLSSSVQSSVLNRLLTDIKCANSLVWVTQPVVGAGSTLAAPLYQDAAVVYAQFTQKASVSFYGTGSGKGICRLENNCSSSDTIQPKLIDFAGSDSILGRADYNQFDVQMYPAVAAAVVPVYNLPGINNLVLSLDVLARIYYGAIKVWNDALIGNLNPTIKALLPANRIEVVARSDGSGTTEIFKKGLANASSAFRTIVGISSGTTWGNNTNNVTLKQGNTGVISYVAATRFSIGYAALGEAMESFLQIASLSTGSGTISASVSAIAAAVQVLGASFGNNGDLPVTRLTADLVGAKPPAWPIVGYTYFVMRTTSLRANATCAIRKETVAFLKWFYTSSAMTAVVQSRQFAPLPVGVRTTVLSRLNTDLKCQGQPIVAGTRRWSK